MKQYLRVPIPHTWKDTQKFPIRTRWKIREILSCLENKILQKIPIVCIGWVHVFFGRMLGPISTTNAARYEILVISYPCMLQSLHLFDWRKVIAWQEDLLSEPGYHPVQFSSQSLRFPDQHQPNLTLCLQKAAEHKLGSKTVHDIISKNDGRSVNPVRLLFERALRIRLLSALLWYGYPYRCCRYRSLNSWDLEIFEIHWSCFTMCKTVDFVVLFEKYLW